MLSTVGAQTRVSSPQVVEALVETPALPDEPPRASTEPTDEVDVRPRASVSQLPPVWTEAALEKVPRTFRLKPATASELRAAWLEAKRDDVLLTAQDFATVLVEEALAARRRGARTATSR